MKDNHTWVICAYGESDYLEACIQSLKIKLFNLKLSAIVQRHWIRLRNFVSVMLSHFILNKVGGLARIGIMLSLL